MVCCVGSSDIRRLLFGRRQPRCTDRSCHVALLEGSSWSHLKDLAVSTSILRYIRHVDRLGAQARPRSRTDWKERCQVRAATWMARGSDAASAARGWPAEFV